MNTRKGILLKTKIVILFLFLLFLPALLLVAGENYQINSYIGSKPTIDGSIDTIEQQSTGQQEEITLQFSEWFVGGDQLPRTVKIGSSFTNDSYLYINTVVEYDNIVGGNITYLLRKSGYDKPYDAPYDLKRVTSVTNSSLDGYREYLDSIHSNQFYDDTEFGGLHNSVGKCFISESSLTFELLVPLDSGDTLGNDLSVTLADQIELEIDLRFWYDDANWDQRNEYDWSDEDTCTIVFVQESAPVPIRLLSIIFSSILIISFRIRRKKLASRD